MSKKLGTNWMDLRILQSALTDSIFGTWFRHDKNKLELAKAVFLNDCLVDYKSKNSYNKSDVRMLENMIDNEIRIEEIGINQYQYFKKGQDIYFRLGSVQEAIRGAKWLIPFNESEELPCYSVLTEIEKDLLELSITCLYRYGSDANQIETFISVNILYRLLKSYDEELFDNIFPDYREVIGNEDYKSEVFDQIFEVEFK